MFDLENVIRLISNFSVWIPIVVYLWKFKTLPKQSHIIGVIVILSMAFDMAGLIRRSYSLSNVVLFNVYYLIWHTLLTRYYYLILFKQFRKTYFKIGIAIALGSYVFITFFVQSINEYQGFAWTVSCVVLAMYGIIYTNHQIKNPPMLDRNFQSTLFINGGIVVFTVFSFFLFVFDQYLLSRQPEILEVVWSFHNVNNIVKNIAFAIGLYLTGKSNMGLTEREAEELKRNYPGIRID